MKKVVLVISLALLGLSSCQKNSDDLSKKKDSLVSPAHNVQVEKGGELDPIANPNAVPGGIYTTWGSSFPKSLNMWLDYNSFSVEVMGLLFEQLVTLHSKSNKPTGILAEKWEISDDKKEFTFTIHSDAKWSDGKSITSEDIQFFYDVMMNKSNLTSIFRVDLKRFERPEVIDERTIKIVAKETHWSNFWSAAGLSAFPKHIWKDLDFNKQNFEFPVVSGPYQIKEVAKGRFLSLKRRGDWWGRVKKYNQYKYNFQEIKYKFMEDRTKALEAFKKGVFDAYSVYTSSIWMKETNFDAVKKGWVNRQRIHNSEPKGFQGFAINMRSEKFKDVRVREALCYLINRELMNEKLMFNQYFLLNSYYPDLYPENKNPNVPMRSYDPEKARALLKEAGWKVGEKGILEKDGKTFDLTFLTHSSDQRHLNIYLEDIKRVGINANVEQLSLSSLRKRLDNHKFDLYWTAWGASRLRDPEASWHSSTAEQVSTNNMCGVADKQIDSLIEVQKTEMDLNIRNEILKHIDRRLNEIIPYVLLWQSDNHRLLHWDRFGTPKYVFDKFNREDAIVTYWWFDQTKSDALDSAMKKGQTVENSSGDIFYKD